MMGAGGMGAAAQAAAAAFGIAPAEIYAATRGVHPAAQARFCAYLLCRDVLGQSLVRIGGHFGRDHTTVLHGVRRAAALLSEDGDFLLRYEAARARVQAPQAVPVFRSRRSAGVFHG